MNPGLKQRLVGAVVLIALAVIFLPMLLPGNGGSTMPLFGSNVPAAPGTRFEPIEIPIQTPPPAPSTQVSVVDQPTPGDVASNEKPQQPPLVAPAPAAAPPSVAVAPPAAAPTPTQPPVVAAPPAPVKPAQSQPPVKQTAPTQPPAAPSRTPGEAWDVQLGSFSSSVNALALQDKVRKAGFSAYVEKVKAEQGISYRVRIGPESSRDRADALRQQVQGKMKMNGIVVPHK